MLVAEDAQGPFARAVRDACAELGASVAVWSKLEAAGGADVETGGAAEEQSASPVEELAAEQRAAAALAPATGTQVLVVDAAAIFTRAGADREGLAACLQRTWELTRATVVGALLPGERGGRIVYLTPPPTAGAHAEAGRAGLENLARTLSIEWARHQITTVAIAPGAHTSAGEVAALVAYLASPAGAYFSGCLLDLRGTAPGSPGAG